MSPHHKPRVRLRPKATLIRRRINLKKLRRKKMMMIVLRKRLRKSMTKYANSSENSKIVTKI